MVPSLHLFDRVEQFWFLTLAGNRNLARWSLWNWHWFYCFCVSCTQMSHSHWLVFSFFAYRDSLTGVMDHVFRENVGLLGLTRVGSRRVIQISAGFMIFFSILGWHYLFQLDNLGVWNEKHFLIVFLLISYIRAFVFENSDNMPIAKW